MLSVPGPWMAAEVRRKRRTRTKRTEGKPGRGEGAGQTTHKKHPGYEGQG